MIRKKLLINYLDKIKHDSQIELCGIVIDVNKRFFKLLNFLYKIGIYKNKNLDIPLKRCLFFCKIFVNKNHFALFCTDFKCIDIFEEIFFAVESLSFIKKHELFLLR